MTNLNTYGWNSTLNQLKQKSTHHSLSHARVSIVHRTCYEVISENGTFLCELTGNMLFGKSDFDLPCVGDWVIFQPFDENKGIIVDILPRERILFRKKIGTSTDKQAIASYVDKAFIVQSLDDNFNPRRAERFMAQILDAGIQPVLVLNKCDLDFDKQRVDDEISHIMRQISVFFTSVQQPHTVRALQASTAEGETVVFVGSSGVGKSSLVNALCENSALAVSEISASTGKGRHTSTRREMVLMKNSGVLIDTPGVREFGLAVENPDSLAEMLEISDFEKACRFADCTHTNEPDCAVLEAINNGSLDAKVFESYRKLQREAWHFSTSEYEKRQRYKQFAKVTDDESYQKQLRKWNASKDNCKY